MRAVMVAIAVALLPLTAACQEGADSQTPAAAGEATFPAPNRPVAPIVSDQYSNEDSRERLGEAERLQALLGVRDGMAVADIGAGKGYHTVRLARAVAPTGKVYATDLAKPVIDRLEARARREKLTNIVGVIGAPDDPRLPPASIDLALMVRMYHEIEQPYAFLWRLRDALRPGGRVAILEGERPIPRHGTPPALLRCELAAVGYRQVAFHRDDAFGDGYLAVFEPSGPRPAPDAITPCQG